MFKIIVGDEHIKSDRLGVDTPTVIPIEQSGLIKTAAMSPDVEDFVRAIPKDPNRTRLLVIAMGAGDWYGPNKNGDYFAENELIPNHNTFEEAKFFKHHVNKDPAKSYGDVLKSFYNDRMHRVELIIDIINQKAPDTVAKVKAGIPIAVSMGCRVKYDICSICGNKAPSRAQYCDHAKFNMGNILPDGRIVYVYNPNPRFFDISEVFKPADQMGWSLKKVASVYSQELSADLGDFANEVNSKLSTLKKTNDILKRLQGIAVDADKVDNKLLDYLPQTKLAEPEQLGNPVIRVFIKRPLGKVMASCRSVGAPLTSSELEQVLTGKGMLPDGVAHNVLPALDRTMEKRPDLVIGIKRVFISNSNDGVLEPIMSSVSRFRSLLPEILSSRLMGEKPKVKMIVVHNDSKPDVDMEDVLDSEAEKVGASLLFLGMNRQLPYMFEKKSDIMSCICAHYVDAHMSHFGKTANESLFPETMVVLNKIASDGDVISSDTQSLAKFQDYSNLLGKAFIADIKNN